MKRIKKFLSVLIVNSIILIILLLAIEGISRFFIPGNTQKAIFNDKDLRVRGRPFVEHHSTRGFALKPNFQNTLYTIDHNGFRVTSTKTEKKPKFTILTMGESTTFGWMVKDNETYPYYLAQELQKKYPSTQVINAGIPSYTSSQVLAYLKEILTKKTIHPNIILINIMWNDIWYSTIQNWHPDILIYQKPPEWIVFLTKHSHLFKVLQEKAAQKEENSLTDRFNKEALDYYKYNIEEMIRLCKSAHIPLYFIEPPLDADHISKEGLNEFHVRYTKPFLIKMGETYFRTLKQVASSKHIPVIQQSLGLQNLHQKTLFLDALHPTAEGNKIMAEDIALELEKLLPESRKP
jgi:lysophospholipase L1-like esterase